MEKENLHLNSFLVISLTILFSCSKEIPIPAREIDATEVPLGCDGAKYNDWETSEYVLPYPIGQTYAISLSHCSGSYHSIGRPDQFAIDFRMNIGTAITACRAGKVVFVEESGFDRAFPNNLVVLQHEDGTYLQYMHLTHEGAEVSIGQDLSKGQLVGYSGSTGLAGFPHLHLVATSGGSWQYPYTSFPTTFSNTRKNEISLQKGDAYSAPSY